MPNPVELERRLRAAAGAAPDAERALEEVRGRIRRRDRRRRALAAVAVVAVLAGATGLVVAVTGPGGDGDGDSDGATVYAGDPDETGPASRGKVEAQLRWRTPGVGMGGWATSNGRVVVPSGDRVITAEGPGPSPDSWTDGSGPRGRISALDRDTGEVLWAIELGGTTEYGGPAFVQGVVGDTVVANTQYDRIVGLDAADGSLRWEISLPELGLDGYGAVTSAVTTPRSAIGLSARTEGDVRPPVVLGVDPGTGEVAWTATLDEGTDLMLGVPPADGGGAVFASTLSHPGSAEENVAHLVDLADGSIRWRVGMGGGQGFSSHPAVLAGDLVHLPAHPDVATVDRADGAPRWRQAGARAATDVAGNGLWVLTGEGGLARLDRSTGEVTGELDAPVADSQQILDLGGGRLGVAGPNGLAVVEATGDVGTRASWGSALVDQVAVDGDEVFVATEDQAVAAYRIGPAATATTTTPGHGVRLDPAGPLAPGEIVTIIPDDPVPAGTEMLVAQCSADVLDGSRLAAVDRCTSVGHETAGAPLTLEVARAWRRADGGLTDCTEPGSCIALVRVGGPTGTDDRWAPLTFGDDRSPLATVEVALAPPPDGAGHRDAEAVDLRLDGLQPGEQVVVRQCAPEVVVGGVGGRPCDALDELELRADRAGRVQAPVVLHHDVFIGVLGPGWVTCDPCELRVEPDTSEGAVLPVTLAPTATPSRPTLRIEAPGPHAPGSTVTLVGSGFRGAGPVGVGWCRAGADPEQGPACVRPMGELDGVVPGPDGTLRIDGFPLPGDHDAPAGARCADAPGTCVLAWQPGEASAYAAVLPLDLSG